MLFLFRILILLNGMYNLLVYFCLYSGKFLGIANFHTMLYYQTPSEDLYDGDCFVSDTCSFLLAEWGFFKIALIMTKSYFLILLCYIIEILFLLNQLQHYQVFSFYTLLYIIFLITLATSLLM
jgi:hypothetical protein